MNWPQVSWKMSNNGTWYSIKHWLKQERDLSQPTFTNFDRAKCIVVYPLHYNYKFDHQKQTLLQAGVYILIGVNLKEKSNLQKKSQILFHKNVFLEWNTVLISAIYSLQCTYSTLLTISAYLGNKSNLIWDAIALKRNSSFFLLLMLKLWRE